MKLLLCPICNDVFKLSLRPRSCECGRVTGRYIDDLLAETNGKGISLAIGNGSLTESIKKMLSMQMRNDLLCAYPVFCWVRPNTGPSNSNTVIAVEFAKK
jgi:hypothetical protein